MTEYEEKLFQSVETIRQRMKAAAEKAGRNPGDILLCAACKTRTVEEVRTSASLPIDLFGENHVQELVEKTDAGAYLEKPGHFIGHLQTNKIKQVLGRAAIIESVDSMHLALAIEKEAAKRSLKQDILIEINIGREASKGGIFKEDLWSMMDTLCREAPHLNIRGLMAIPPLFTEESVSRGYFSEMKKLFDEAAVRYAGDASMDYLSMGMSNDYELAIEEGSNIVRLGTAIYGPRFYPSR